MGPPFDRLLASIQSHISTQEELAYFLIHQDRYKEILRRIEKFGLPKGARVLDIGCYPLHLYEALKELSFEMYGISSEHEPVRDKHIVSLNIERDKFPYKNNFFDAVLCSEVIEHLTSNPFVYMKEIQRVLKPGGLCIITTPNAVHLKNRIKVLLGYSSSFSLDQLYGTTVGDSSIYFRHNREFTLNELTEIIKKSGLTLQGAQYVSIYTPFRRKISQESLVVKMGKSLGYMLTLFIPTLRDTVMAVATK